MLLTKFLLPPLLTTLFVLLLLRNNLRYDRAAESAFNILSGDFEPDEAFLLRPKARRRLLRMEGLLDRSIIAYGDLEDDDSYGSYFEHYDDEDEEPYYTAAGAAAAGGTGHGMSAGGSGFSKEGFREDSRGSSAAEGGKGSAGKGEEAPPYPFSGEGGGHSPD